MRSNLALVTLVLLLAFTVGGFSQTVKTIYVDQTIPEDWNPGFKIGRVFPTLLIDRLKIGGVSLTDVETNSSAIFKCEPYIVITIHGTEPSKSAYNCQLFSTVGKKKLWKGQVSFLEMKDAQKSDERAADAISKKFINRYRKGIKY